LLHRYPKKSGLLKFCFVPATIDASSKGHFCGSLIFVAGLEELESLLQLFRLAKLTTLMHVTILRVKSFILQAREESMHKTQNKKRTKRIIDG